MVQFGPSAADEQSWKSCPATGPGTCMWSFSVLDKHCLPVWLDDLLFCHGIVAHTVLAITITTYITTYNLSRILLKKNLAFSHPTFYAFFYINTQKQKKRTRSEERPQSGYQNNIQAAAGAAGQGHSLPLYCIVSDLQPAKYPLPHVPPWGPTKNRLQSDTCKHITIIHLHAHTVCMQYIKTHSHSLYLTLFRFPIMFQLHSGSSFVIVLNINESHYQTHFARVGQKVSMRADLLSTYLQHSITANALLRGPAWKLLH